METRLFSARGATADECAPAPVVQRPCPDHRRPAVAAARSAVAIRVCGSVTATGMVLAFCLTCLRSSEALLIRARCELSGKPALPVHDLDSL